MSTIGFHSPATVSPHSSPLQKPLTDTEEPDLLNLIGFHSLATVSAHSSPLQKPLTDTEEPNILNHMTEVN